MATFSPFYKIRIFTFDDVMNETGLSRAGTSTALARWQMQGLLKPVRRNLYVAINPSSDTPIADKYELCSRISATSYVGWHTALEFHGVAHQPFYNAYVGSKTRFNQFSFYGTDYEYCAAPLEPTEANGIIRPLGNPYVRVSDLERSIIDSCDRIERAGGVEELLHCMESVTLLNEGKLEKYLSLYNKVFLYQKVGFILEQSQEYHHVSDSFIEMCRTRGAIYTKHLTMTENSNFYLCKWKLYVPKNCVTENNKEEYELR